MKTAMRATLINSLFGSGRGDPTDERYRKSPSPKTGGKVPLPSFDESGEYFPPTPVPLNPRMPRNTLMPQKPIDARRLKEITDKIKALGGLNKLL